jgi:maltodextrin utilization protein YvdJ
MHLMHLIWIAGHIIGFFHQPSVIVITVMTIVGLILIFVFYKVFENDLFGNPSDD